MKNKAYIVILKSINFRLQGRRKIFYGRDLSKNVGYHSGATTKDLKIALAKTP